MATDAKKRQNLGDEMTFWEHLEELRWHLMRAAIAVILVAIVAFFNKDFIFNNLILAPKNDTFITNRILCSISELLNIKALCISNFSLNIINISMSGQFMTHLYISLISGIVFAMPYVVFEIWRFVKPALDPVEQKRSSGAVFVVSFLFYLGVLFSYFIIVPLTVNFLGTYVVSEEVMNQISLSSYISTVLSVTLSVGLVFELPVLVLFLARAGIITPGFLRKNRRVMIVVILALAAIITPPDVFSQILVALPLYLLYEISIGIAERVAKRRKESETAD